MVAQPGAARVADAELKITSTAKTRRPAGEQTAKNEALAAAATAMRERAAAAAEAPAEPTEPVAPRENVESIEVKLLDGRVVQFGPPPGISLTMRIAITLPNATGALDRLARICMSIRSVDGQAMRPITNLVDLTAVANAIGDVGMDELNFWFDRHWGMLRISDLQLLKKNLRE